jgi:hypothetical protein
VFVPCQQDKQKGNSLKIINTQEKRLKVRISLSGEFVF